MKENFEIRKDEQIVRMKSKRINEKHRLGRRATERGKISYRSC